MLTRPTRLACRAGPARRARAGVATSGRVGARRAVLAHRRVARRQALVHIWKHAHQSAQRGRQRPATQRETTRRLRHDRSHAAAPTACRTTQPRYKTKPSQHENDISLQYPSCKWLPSSPNYKRCTSSLRPNSHTRRKARSCTPLRRPSPSTRPHLEARTPKRATRPTEARHTERNNTQAQT